MTELLHQQQQWQQEHLHCFDTRIDALDCQFAINSATSKGLSEKNPTTSLGEVCSTAKVHTATYTTFSATSTNLAESITEERPTAFIDLPAPDLTAYPSKVQSISSTGKANSDTDINTTTTAFPKCTSEMDHTTSKDLTRSIVEVATGTVSNFDGSTSEFMYPTYSSVTSSNTEVEAATATNLASATTNFTNSTTDLKPTTLIKLPSSTCTERPSQQTSLDLLQYIVKEKDATFTNLTNSNLSRSTIKIKTATSTFVAKPAAEVHSTTSTDLVRFTCDKPTTSTTSTVLSIFNLDDMLTTSPHLTSNPNNKIKSATSTGLVGPTSVINNDIRRPKNKASAYVISPTTVSSTAAPVSSTNFTTISTDFNKSMTNRKPAISTILTAFTTITESIINNLTALRNNKFVDIKPNHHTPPCPSPPSCSSLNSIHRIQPCFSPPS